MGIDSTSDGADSPIVVVTHPTERRRGRTAVPVQAGPCCCCCCCCCLHSLGGIIGAAIGANLGVPEPRNYMPLLSYWDEEETEASPPSLPPGEGITAAAPVPAGREPLQPSDPERRFGLRNSGPSAVGLFWWTFLVLALLGFVGFNVWAGGGGVSIVGGVILLLTLPAFQLGAGLVAALILAMSSRSDKSYQFRQLGKILLGMVAGTMVGMLVMVGLVVFARGSRFPPDALVILAMWGGIPALFLIFSVLGLRALTRR